MKNLIAFNKPYGVICQFSPHETHKSLKDYIDAPGFYPAGRLDTDSEGLLLLTDNGRLQAQIAEPKHGKEKTYWAQVEGSPDEARLDMLQKGIDLGGFVTRPAKVRILQPEEPPVCGRATRPCANAKPCLISGLKSPSAKAKTAKCGG